MVREGRREEPKQEDPYLESQNKEADLETLLKSPEYQKKMGERVDQMLKEGKSRAEILRSLTEPMQAVQNEGQVISTHGYDDEAGESMDPEKIKERQQKKIEDEKEQVEMLKEMVGEEDPEIEREVQEMRRIMEIVETEKEEHASRLSRDAQRSLGVLDRKIEEARREFKERVRENQHDLVLNEAELDSGIQPRTMAELALEMPQDRDAIRYTLAELDGEEAVEQLIKEKAEGDIEGDSEGNGVHI